MTGQHANFTLKKRISSLKQLVVLIEGLNSQISFTKKPVSEIISSMTCSGDVKLKTMCEFSKMSHENFFENWKKAIEKYYIFDCLSDEDSRILLSFGKNLGITDLDGQKNNCRLHLTMLEKQLSNAEKNLNEKAKINTALSAFFALAVMIIFY